MKKHFWTKVLITFVILLIASSAYAIAGSKESIVKQLVCRRTDIMNSFIIGNIDYKHASEALALIENERLLEEDTSSMKAYFRTDIEAVTEYRVKKIEITYDDGNVLCADVNIAWTLRPMEEGDDDISEVSYSIICKKEAGKYKLVQFV